MVALMRRSPKRTSWRSTSIVILYVLFLDYYVSGLTAGAVQGS
jgi:hypothetical protein